MLTMVVSGTLVLVHSILPSSADCAMAVQGVSVKT